MILLSETITVSIDKDWFTFLTFFVSTLILAVTAWAVWRAPLKAVEIGRTLSEIQKKNDEKTKLFLTLFALRGTPLSYEFVLGLNQIEIIFQGCDFVLSAWQVLRLELQKEPTESQQRIYVDRTNDLLTRMAQNLGYDKIVDSVASNHYYPKGFENWSIQENNLKLTQLDYYKKSIEFYDLMTPVYQESLSQKSEPENS